MLPIFEICDTHLEVIKTRRPARILGLPGTLTLAFVNEGPIGRGFRYWEWRWSDETGVFALHCPFGISHKRGAVSEALRDFLTILQGGFHDAAGTTEREQCDEPQNLDAEVSSDPKDGGQV